MVSNHTSECFNTARKEKLRLKRKVNKTRDSKLSPVVKYRRVVASLSPESDNVNRCFLLSYKRWVSKVVPKNEELIFLLYKLVNSITCTRLPPCTCENGSSYNNLTSKVSLFTWRYFLQYEVSIMSTKLVHDVVICCGALN